MATEYVRAPFQPQLSENPQVLEVINALDGAVIERDLIEFAKFGGVQIPGTTQTPERYAVTRLALSSAEFEAKRYLAQEMALAGMKVVDHPLGLIGMYEGTDPSLLPVAMGSHYDSVPEAGMYDGTAGVFTSLNIIREMHKQKLRLPRGVEVVFVTGEESARFNCALFGSKGMTQGLDEATLSMKKNSDITIGEAIQAQGYEINQVRTPVITPENTAAFIELHIDQSGDLERNGMDLAVIEAIAGPDRRQVIIGDTLEPDTTDFGITRHFQMDILGIADHSGATPMGEKYRADGLAASAEIIKHIARIQRQLSKDGKQLQISIGDVDVKSGALNKVPGLTSTDIRVTGADPDEINSVITELQTFIRDTDTAYHSEKTRFNGMNETNRMQLTETDLAIKPFYDANEMAKRHELAADVVQAVQYITTGPYMHEPVVGTVGTYTVKEGKIVLGVDIRGIDSKVRSSAVETILKRIKESNYRNYQLPLEIKQMTGSSEPVTMDEGIVKAASYAIESFGIGTSMVDYSRAGHDAMNMQKARIPSTMIFVPSGNKGISHHPDEFTTADALGKGAKALAATIFTLASR